MGRTGSCRRAAIALVVASALGSAGGCTGAKWTETESGTLRIVTNQGGRTLGYSSTSGIGLVFDDGFAFKDLIKTGTLEPYEDWRLSADERARDLGGRMSVAQIAGLMLYSAHQAIPAVRGPRPSTYGGKPFGESGADPADLSDQQKDILTSDNLRHVLITSVESPEVAARWNNSGPAPPADAREHEDGRRAGRGRPR